MTNYNDGRWHGWNGGKCPVHPDSVVDIVWHEKVQNKAGVFEGRQAIEPGWPRIAWDQVVKFRVTKEHREPREFWIENGVAYDHVTLYGIHVREVLK